VAPRSRTRLGLGLDAALEAYVGVDAVVRPLPWALGLPVGGGGLEVGAFASLTLGCRSATDFVRAVMELLKALRLVWSCLFGWGLFVRVWEGMPSMSWKVGCI
jgi:hypothetical protein